VFSTEKIKFQRVIETIFIFLLAFYSLWLMFHTFNYDYAAHKITMSFKVWGDFGLAIPLIRSFSLGENWPPQYPLYPGEPIKYHFLFFYLVGMLEKWGLPIHWALNIPSATGFFAILFGIYSLGKKLFNDKRVGALAVVFFLLNGSLSFIEWLSKNPFSKIFSTIEYSTAGPWDGNRVISFWHMGVYINQRHFCFALGILLSLMVLCTYYETLSRRFKTISAIVMGLLIGTLLTLHEPVCLMTAITMTIYFLFFRQLRLYLFCIGVLSLSVMALIYALGGRIQPNLNNIVQWYPGFTVHDQLSFFNVIKFWWFNIGFHLILIPIGFYFAPKKAKIFLSPAFVIFALGFLVSFNTDILTNHKFFNFFLILAPLFSAFALFKFSDWFLDKNISLKILGYSAFTLILICTTLSGVIDFFGMKNSLITDVPDIVANPAASWIYTHTPPQAVFLNSSLFFHPASIAGRKIFEGPHYVTGGPGYDIYKRFGEMTQMYQSKDPKIICDLMKRNNLTYMTVQDTTKDEYMPKIPVDYFKNNFKADFISPDNSIFIYSVGQLCGT